MLRHRPSVNDIVFVLQRSMLPTVLVEGDDDRFYLRRLLQTILRSDGGAEINVLPCGGRDALLQIYHRRGEFAHAKVAWLADLDFWLFQGVEVRYSDIVFTEGYSLENDLLSGAYPRNLFDANDQRLFEEWLAGATHWFASEVGRLLAGDAANVDLHIKSVVEGSQIKEHYWQTGRVLPIGHDLVGFVRQDPLLRLRGKSLLQAFEVVLDRPERTARHKGRAIVETSVAFPGNDCLERLIRRLRAKVARPA